MRGSSLVVSAGAKVLGRSNPRVLRILFSAVIFLLALEMIFNGITGRI